MRPVRAQSGRVAFAFGCLVLGVGACGAREGLLDPGSGSFASAGSGGVIGVSGSNSVGASSVGAAGGFGVGGAGAFGGFGAAGGSLPTCPSCEGVVSDPCQVATCDPATGGCVISLLEDGASCTLRDQCQLGTCFGGFCDAAPKDCSDIDVPNECYAAGCNPTTGECEAIPTTGNTCADPNDKCRVGKTCENGQCRGGAPKDCSQLDDMCVVGQCQASTGACIETAAPANTSCDDDDACTGPDVCEAMSCGGEPVVNCTDDDGCCPEGCAVGEDTDCGVLCADILTNIPMWGLPARGVLLSEYTNGTLDWIGCPGNGCIPESFYCTDLENGIQFGTNGSSTLRALVDPGDERGNNFPTQIAPENTGCCSAKYPWGVCNALDPDSNGKGISSVEALCKALGYAHGEALDSLTGNFCPNPHPLDASGSTWTSDWDEDLDWINEYRCTND